jgi:uncharacterized protein
MRIAVVFIALVLTACGGAPKDNYYTLTAPPAPASSAANAVSIFVGPVLVPEGVDRAPMVIHVGPNQVDVRDDQRWAEPLKHAIPRVISENLMRELGTTRVSWSRLGAGQPVDFKVAIDVQRFDSSFDAGAAIDAAWVVTPAKGAVRSGRSTISEPSTSKDPAGVAAAHSRALERLAKEIAAGIK